MVDEIKNAALETQAQVVNCVLCPFLGSRYLKTPLLERCGKYI